MEEIIFDTAGNLFKIEYFYDLGYNQIITSISAI